MNKLPIFLRVVTAACTLMVPAFTQSPGAVSTGTYECWANGEARLLLNFTIRNRSQYTDSEGKPGAYSYDSASGRVTFKGGMLDGAMPNGFQAIYHEPKGKPTVSFRSPRGSEAAFCEKVKN
jgi:hypothetical protein